MKKSLLLAAALVILASASWAAISLNSSRSNIYRVISDAPPAQVTAMLAQLDGTGLKDEAGLTRWLLANAAKFGGQAWRKVIVLPPKHPGTPWQIILLVDPTGEGQARIIAVSDSGVASNPTPVPPPHIKK